MTKVLGVTELDEEVPDTIPADGVISSEFVLFKDLSDDVLEMIYENDPQWVMEKRPDYIQRIHPNKVN